MKATQGSGGMQLCWVVALFVPLVFLAFQPRVAARPSDVFRRHLSQSNTAFPVCGAVQGCKTGPCTFCPYPNCATVPQIPTAACSNLFIQPPTVGIGSIVVDNDLCSDWAPQASNVTFLGSMYPNGDCSSQRFGSLYALYDCSKKVICLKTAGCQCTPKNCSTCQDLTYASFPAYDPGVDCGCSPQQAQRSGCIRPSDTVSDNWFSLYSKCPGVPYVGTHNASNIPYGHNLYYLSGWEYCYPAAANTTYLVQATMGIFGSPYVGIGPGAPGGQSQPSEYPPAIQFRTPECVCKASLTGSPACAVGQTVDIVFSYAGIDVKTPTPADLSVVALDSTGQTVTGVSCSGLSISVLTSTITVTCSMASGGGFQYSNIDFSKVNLTWAVKGNGGCSSLPIVASAPITLAPSLSLGRLQWIPAFVCDDQPTVTLTIPYSATHGTPTFNQPSSCNVTQPVPGFNTANWTCSTLPTSAYRDYVLVGTVAATGPCTGNAGFAAVIPKLNVVAKPTLNITSPTASPIGNVCRDQPTVTLNFTYTATGNVTPTFEVPADCTSVTGTNVVAVTCPTAIAEGGITVKGTVAATAPCPSATASATSSSFVGVLKPTLNITDAAAPSVCGDQPTVTLNFTYTATGNATPTFEVPADCTSVTGFSIVAVTCPTAVAEGGITVKGTVAATAPCLSATANATSSSFVGVLKPTLNITDAAAPSVCGDTPTVTLNFTYTATGNATPTFEVPADCTSVTGSSIVALTCPTAVAEGGISVKGMIPAQAPCTSNATATATSPSFMAVDQPTLNITDATAPSVCGDQPTVTLNFTYTATGNATPTFEVPADCTSVTGSDIVVVTCPTAIADGGITVKGTIAAKAPCVSNASATAIASKFKVGPKPSLNISAPTTPPDVCRDQPTVTLNFNYTAIGAASPTFEVFNPRNGTCDITMLSGSNMVAVTCPTAVAKGGITVRGTVPALAPCVGNASATATSSNFTVALKPTLNISAPTALPDVCRELPTVTLNFNYTASGGTPTFEVAKPSTVTCNISILPGSQVAVTCPTTVAKGGITVKGIVLAQAPCTSNATDSARSSTFTVFPKPTMNISPPTAPPDVCQDQPTVTLNFNYTASGGTPTFEVANSNNGTCNLTLLPGSQVAVTCPTAVAKGGITVKGTVATSVPCTANASDAARSPSFLVVSKPTLNITADTTTLCYDVNISQVSAVCRYRRATGLANASDVQWATDAKCTAVPGSTNTALRGTVNVTCPASADGTQVVTKYLNLTGTISNASAPCGSATTGPVTAIVLIDTKPSVTVSLAPGIVQPIVQCSSAPLKANFTYSIYSIVGSAVSVSVLPRTLNCTTAGAPTSLVVSPATGSIQASCTGKFVVGAKQTITLSIAVRKPKCTYQAAKSADATFKFTC